MHLPARKILCPAIILVFLLQACYITPAMLASATPNPEPTPTLTTVLLLDNPSKLLVWNTTGEISAKLVQSQDNQPVASQNLELYFKQKEEGNWTLYSNNRTDEAGVVKFSFLVNMTDGRRDYMVFFGGHYPYFPAANESYVIVTQDPYYPKFDEVTIQATDKAITIYFEVSLTFPEGLDRVGGLTDLEVDLYYYPPSPAPPAQTIAHLDMSREAILYSGSFSTDNVGGYRTYSLCDAKATVYLVATAYADYYYRTDKSKPYTHEKTSTDYYAAIYQIVDDDTSPPTPVGSPNPDPSRTMQDTGTYDISFSYSDPSGWEGRIKYLFTNGSYTSPTFERSIGNTSETGTFTMTCSIPKYGDNGDGWGRYPNTTINFSTMAIDNDLDGYWRVWDRCASSWSKWIPGGTFYNVVGGKIEDVRAYASVGDTWQFQSVGSPDNPMYILDGNYINLTIANPINKTMVIDRAWLSFTSSSGIKPAEEDDFYVGEIKPYDIFYAINRYAVFENPALDGADITITFTFSYHFKSDETEFSMSSVKTLRIVKPPEPEVKFTGFVGTRESGVLVLKTDTGGAEFQARFTVTNKARISISGTLDFPYPFAEYNGVKLLSSYENGFNLYGGESKTLTSKLQFVDPAFFQDEDRTVLAAITGILKASDLVKAIILAFYKLSKLAQKQVVGAFGAVTSFLLAIYNSYIFILADQSHSSTRSLQALPFETRWKYHHGGSSLTTDYSDLEYDPLQGTTGAFSARASSTQEAEFGAGIVLEALSVGLYTMAGFCYASVVSYLVGAFWAAAAAIATFAAQKLWTLANDDVPPSDNYTSIFVPEYRNANPSGFEPATEFESGALSLSDSCVTLLGDVAAVSETESRKAGAIAAGDYQSALMQNDALINYTRMVADDYGDMKNDLSVMSTLTAQNSSELVGVAQSLESSASIGLTQEDIAALQNGGLNWTEIVELNRTTTGLASTGSLSENFTTGIVSMLGAFNSSIPYLNSEIERLENASNELVQESINIKTNLLHENVTTADSETLTALGELEGEMLNAFSVGDWNGAISFADQLLDLAQRTATITNNQTYLLTFGKDAQDIKQQAGEFLKITLQHIPEVAVTLGEPVTVTLIVRSEGAPTGNYTFETNSSWLGQNGTIIHLTRYNFTVLRLQILVEKNPLIAPGYYPVNLKVYLNNTGTIVNSILTVKVQPFHEVHASVTPVAQAILDNQTAVFHFNVTNTGNVPDTYHLNLLNLVNCTYVFMENDVPIANNMLTDMAPGETRFILLVVHPTGLGTSYFTIQVASQEASTSTNGTLVITDDDTIGPVVTISVTSYRLNPAGGVDVLFNISASDPKRGVDLNHVFITVAGQNFTTLGSHVITLYALGDYTINVTVSNADNDWLGDEEWTAAHASFSISLGDDYGLIASEFDSLEAYCAANLSGYARMHILWELNKAEAKFQNAWLRYQAGELPRAVVKDIISQILTDNVGRVVDHLNDRGLIGDAEVTYLAERLLLLRNQLALFAGFMVGTESSRQLALANNAANNLAVYVNDELPSYPGALHLERGLRALAYCLNGIILLDAMDRPIGWAATRAMNELYCLRSQVSVIASRGYITSTQEAVLLEGLNLIAGHLSAAISPSTHFTPAHIRWWCLTDGFASRKHHLLLSSGACYCCPTGWSDLWNMLDFLYSSPNHKC